ncbi:uncharacterized protein F4822DRAFT_205905 [Hypoxylon trugodes]|uniref:uncharacterized protein n=1 Tax=Hypoxylon trugodes TaxID=326681 RepID=UPI0021988B56|nr:uncharacterized protein F4822DRAFT_205905 [Hypoxylon trugodes]KAI1389603.1 hypothetical protein F4822DRAFT_205905 [Hypoxylon trugodes]
MEAAEMLSPHENNELNSQYIENAHPMSQLPEVLDQKPAESAVQSMYPSGPAQPSAHSENRNPFNLNLLSFGALVSLITALIVGAVIGGALGASLHKSREGCEMPSSDATPSEAILPSGPETTTPEPTHIPTSTLSSTESTAYLTTDYAAPRPSRVATLDIDCPALDGTVLDDWEANQYHINCGRRYIGGGDTETWSAVVAYSIQDCLQACSLLNDWWRTNLCTAVTWCSTMADCTSQFGGNCWLFNSTPAVELNENYTIANINR